MARLFLFFILTSALISSCAHTNQQKEYPDHWWKKVSDTKSWEISPDTVSPPQVILSKRNELGVLSNFAATPFELDGKKFGSLEGFWQAMKYPEDKLDPRFPLAKWPHTRQEVEMMTGFDAKRAGDFASKVMKENKSQWVSFKGERMEYRAQNKGAFYQLIKRATVAKIEQNPKVKETLMATKGLSLLPDHNQGPNPPPAWKYYQIYMDLRDSQSL